MHLLRLTHTKSPTVSVIIIFGIEQKRPNDLPHVHYPIEKKRRETAHGITPHESVSLSSWCHQESNRGHKDFQSFALPTELWHHRQFYFLGAEATRFELVVRLPVRQFSKLLVSATHPHFQSHSALELRCKDRMIFLILQIRP